MPVDLFVDFMIECCIFPDGCKRVPPPYHIVNGFLPVSVDTQSQGRTDSRSHTGGAGYLISMGRDPENIGKNLHKQLSVGTTPADHYAGHFRPHFITHGPGVIFHRQSNALQNRTEHMRSFMGAVESNHHSPFMQM